MKRMLTVVVPITAAFAMIVTAAPASAAPLTNECSDADYVVHLKDDLDTGAFTGNPRTAADRARQYAATASPDIAGDAATLVDANVAVLDGASRDVFFADPVIQAWGDVVDWHTVHCL